MEEPHLTPEARHAALAEPPDQRQRAGENHRGQQERRLNNPSAFENCYCTWAGNQHLKEAIVGREHAVLAGDAGDTDAIADAKAAQLMAGVAARSREKYVEVLTARANQKQVAAAIL